MRYMTVAEAREARGLRLILSAGVPGPWGEAAKAILSARGVPYHAVAQSMMEANDDLKAWTGQRNAPVAVLDNEPPIHGWLDLVMLAERLGSGASLLPAGSRERALAIGLSAELCAPYGFGWFRRLLMFQTSFSGVGPPRDAPAHLIALCRDYGFNAAACALAPARLADILEAFADQLHRQRAVGSDYLVGSTLSLCDLHWACFSMMVAPLPEEQAPMPAVVRALWTDIPPAVAAALDPILIAHRDVIYQKHIGMLDY